MQCTWCTQEFKPGQKIVYGGRTLNKYHESCLKAKREEAQKKLQEAMDKAAVAAGEKWCPFAPGHPLACEDESKCITTDCMAWDGYDCRRLQIPEVE